MKSLLVDALRQANEDSSPEVSEDKMRESGVPPGSASAETADSQSLELDLLETGRYEPSADTSLEDAPDTSVDSVAVETLSQSVPADTDTTASKITEHPDPKRLTNQERKTAVARVGHQSPLLCVVAILASAGAYLLLNDLSVMNLYAGLPQLSAREQTSAGMEDGDAHEIKLPLSGVSVFEQIDASPVVKPVADEPEAKPAGNESEVDPVRIPMPEEAPGSTSSISHKSSNAVRDDAYASVMAAYAAYRRRDFGAAEKHYTEALGIEPNHRDGLAGMAAVYLQTDRTERAVSAYERLLAIDPRNTVAAATILTIRSDEADWEIESELKLLLQRFPESHHLHNALGSVYVGQQKWPDAKHEFLSAYRLAPENADYSYNAAVSMDRMGQQAAAQDYYKVALETATEHASFDRTAILAHLDVLAQQQRERL